ncbi:MAG: hypothetical protein C3F02_01715 [Parcubacteria group bacterium]|nr:MAG: hypothetical protein C3F02_01715 [Parcubacteria group bacterium]
MFCKVKFLPLGQSVGIIGYGHTEISDDPRFRVVTQDAFIRDMMSVDGRRSLFGSEPPWSTEDIEAAAEKWVAQTKIRERIFFSGSVVELAVIAARKCLAQAGVRPDQLDVIIGGTNTGPGYPSLADHIKLGLGQPSRAMAYDVAEACSVGPLAVFDGWDWIRSSVCRRALVVCAEDATLLTGYDDWRGSNLFGAGAYAFLLGQTEREAFVFFDGQSLPFDGQIDKIVKTASGFRQDGNAVHKFVGRVVVEALVGAVEAAGIKPSDIDHLVPHQPSGPTLDLLEAKLRKRWPEFRGRVHRHVETTGNTSGASTGQLISAGVKSGVIKQGELVVAFAFGAGLSFVAYGFTV